MRIMAKGPIKLVYEEKGLNVSDAIKIKPKPVNNPVLIPSIINGSPITLNPKVKSYI